MKIYLVMQWYRSEDLSVDDEFLGIAAAHTDEVLANTEAALWTDLEVDGRYYFNVETHDLIGT